MTASSAIPEPHDAPAQKMEQARHSSLSSSQKTASFQAVTQTYPTSAISDGEKSNTSNVDESAIDDDDDDDREDVEGSGKLSADGNKFLRVDSKPDLTSRQSLITLTLTQQRLGNNASQSTSTLPCARNTPKGPLMFNSPNDSDEAVLMIKQGTPPIPPINEVPRSSAQPIRVTATGINYPAALSPRTIRRDMLATELTESLRRQLLWERSQKSSTANAVLKRRHTSQDIANLKQYPVKPYMDKEGDGADGEWDLSNFYDYW